MWLGLRANGRLHSVHTCLLVGGAFNQRTHCVTSTHTHTQQKKTVHVVHFLSKQRFLETKQDDLLFWLGNPHTRDQAL